MLPSATQTRARPEGRLPASMPINHSAAIPRVLQLRGSFLWERLPPFLRSRMAEGYNRPLTAPQLRSRTGRPGHQLCAHHQRLFRPGEGDMRQGPGPAVTRAISLRAVRRAACPRGNRSHWGHEGTREVQVTATYRGVSEITV